MKMANKYPTVMIHGFFGFGEGNIINTVLPYWGFRPDRKVIPFLEAKGYEVYQPHVGPFNSAWDRACILYAYLFGGTVDFGKVHSEKYHHARYGRTYPGVLKDLGQTEAHKKINVVGHSFGGPSVIAFTGLMTGGAPEEVAATPEEELSPLFKGGHGDLIHCATTLSGVNNGTGFASWLREFGVVAVCDVVLLLNAFLKDTAFPKFWDFYLDQFGYNMEPSKCKALHFQNPFKSWKDIQVYAKNQRDNIGHEMQYESMKAINDYMPISDKTYYFARLACRTHAGKNGKHVPNKNMMFLCASVARLCNYIANAPEEYHADESWYPSDGMVNVEGQKAPYNKPSADWDGKDASGLKAGIWYNMPVEDKDHMSWAGCGEKPKVLYKYYEDMLKLFADLPDA